jgi:serine/threonine-protein kinase
MSDAVALHVIIELGEGVHFAHELRGPEGPLGLVHRDISPSNVLVSYSGEVKLSDFGLAKRTTDHSVVGSLKGKLAYMSPEQARCTTLDRRTDIFSLGAVLFEMLTGRRLREITDEVEGWRQVASGLVPDIVSFRPDLPPALAHVLAGALAPDPRDRFPDARAFVAAAREALAGVPRAPTSEVGELQDLLKSVLPPGTPRLPAAPSKVIRLISEFLLADETVRDQAPGHVAARAGLPAHEPSESQPDDPVDWTEPPGESPSLASFTPPDAAPRRVPIRLPRRQPTGSIALFVLALLPGMASLVHYFVIPLPVLARWSAPARLDVGSWPADAAVLLDGRPLSARTPTYTEVARDHGVHFVEVRKDGFQSVRRSIRFDRAEILSVTVTLQAEPRPSISPMPQPAAADDPPTTAQGR